MAAIGSLFFLWVFVSWLILPFLAWKAASEKNMGRTNCFCFTLLTGPFGLIVVLLWPARLRKGF